MRLRIIVCSILEIICMVLMIFTMINTERLPKMVVDTLLVFCGIVMLVLVLFLLLSVIQNGRKK